MRKIDLEGERLYENLKATGELTHTAQSKFYWATEIPTSAHYDLTDKKIKGKNVLEVGCASGVDALRYCEGAWQVLLLVLAVLLDVDPSSFVLLLRK